MPLSLDEIISGLSPQSGNFATLVPGDERVRRATARTLREIWTSMESQWRSRPWYLRLLDCLLFRRSKIQRKMLAEAIKTILSKELQ